MSPTSISAVKAASALQSITVFPVTAVRPLTVVMTPNTAIRALARNSS